MATILTSLHPASEQQHFQVDHDSIREWSSHRACSQCSVQYIEIIASLPVDTLYAVASRSSTDMQHVPECLPDTQQLTFDGSVIGLQAVRCDDSRVVPAQSLIVLQHQASVRLEFAPLFQKGKGCALRGGQVEST